jgi:hypothetical protein
MAEERTLGLARAHAEAGEDSSKEQLQRELDNARNSISHTVTEIKETVENRVQAVKQSLDWREQFRRRPVAWSAGAVGVGFLTGYGLAAALKGDSGDYEEVVSYGKSRSYAAQPLAAGRAVPTDTAEDVEDQGPGFFAKVANSNAYGRVRHEVGEIGDSLVKELTNTAKTLVIPALITSLRSFLGEHLPSTAQKSTTNPDNSPRSNKAYEPRLERT